MLNQDLARKIKDKITTERVLLNQNVWVSTLADNVDENGELIDGTCGTTGCVAGWACMLTNNPIDWSNAETLTGNKLQASRVKGGRWIEEVATRELGLDRYQVVTLFHTYDEDLVLEMLDQIIETGDLDPDDDRWY